MNKFITKYSGRFVGISVIIMTLGCGGKSTSGADTATVSGKVTLPGDKGLPGGTITFTPASGTGTSGTGQINADGTYQASNVPHGDCKVSIDNTTLKGAVESTGMPGMGNSAATKYVPIDPKYTKPATSGLTTNVSGKTHTADFEIK